MKKLIFMLCIILASAGLVCQARAESEQLLSASSLLGVKYQVRQGQSSLGAFESKEQAIAEARKWRSSVVELGGELVWDFHRDLYEVRQGKVRLGYFESKERAVIEARRWKDSIVERAGQVVWSFSKIGYQVRQGRNDLGIFETREQAVAEASKWRDSIIELGQRVVWDFHRDLYGVRQGSVRLGYFESKERAVIEAKRWKDSVIENNREVIWDFQRDLYGVRQGSMRLGYFETKDQAIAEASKWKGSVVENNKRVVWRFSGSSALSIGGRETYIGQSIEELVGIYGSPQRRDVSEKGFTWYIYNEDYSRYLMLGVEGDRVVSIYTNAEEFLYKNEVGFGRRLDDVLKDMSGVLYTPYEGRYDLVQDQAVVTLFEDMHEANTLTAIMIEDREIYSRQAEHLNPELKRSYELQLLDLANSVRVRYGKPSLIYDEKIRVVATEHSEDMANNNFFSHQNMSGESPFDRMRRHEIFFSRAAENIAVGYENSIYTHEALMNSRRGHREAILSNNDFLGVGIAINSAGRVYYTQNFYTLRQGV